MLLHVGQTDYHAGHDFLDMAVLSLSTTDELGEGVPGKIVEPQAQELSM